MLSIHNNLSANPQNVTVQDKIRPLRVCLDNEVTKRKILSRSSQLKSSADWENVYINPDMTLAEHNANKLLRQELKERRNRGEKNLVIRRNKIVSLNNKSPPVSMDISTSTIVLPNDLVSVPIPAPAICTV